MTSLTGAATASDSSIVLVWKKRGDFFFFFLQYTICAPHSDKERRMFLHIFIKVMILVIFCPLKSNKVTYCQHNQAGVACNVGPILYYSSIIAQ